MNVNTDQLLVGLVILLALNLLRKEHAFRNGLALRQGDIEEPATKGDVIVARLLLVAAMVGTLVNKWLSH